MVRHKLQYVYRAIIQGLKILKNRHTIEKKITILKYCTIKLARVVSLKITARLPWYVQHPRHCSAAQNKSLLSRLDAGTYFAPYCCSRHISHSTDDGRARNLVVRRVNKQSHLQADKTIFSPSWKSPNCSSRLFESENEFSSSRGGPETTGIKFPDGYSKVAAILLFSANLQIEIVQDLISANSSGVAEQSNDVAPTFTIARFRGHL